MKVESKQNSVELFRFGELDLTEALNDYIYKKTGRRPSKTPTAITTFSLNEHWESDETRVLVQMKVHDDRETSTRFLPSDDYKIDVKA